MLFIEYPKCTTCRKAKKWLDEHGISYSDRDIKEDNPSEEEMREWIKKSGKPANKFFNTSGMLYRELELKNKLPDMTEDEMIQLLSTNGMLVKRPIIVNGEKILIGFKEKEWEEILL